MPLCSEPTRCNDFRRSHHKKASICRNCGEDITRFRRVTEIVDKYLDPIIDTMHSIEPVDAQAAINTAATGIRVELSEFVDYEIGGEEIAYTMLFRLLERIHDLEARQRLLDTKNK